jgi:hypothetical protein
MLSTGELYNDLGGDYFRKRDPERITKRLIAQLQALGHHVTLERYPRPPEPNRAQARRVYFPVSFPRRLRRRPGAGENVG